MLAGFVVVDSLVEVMQRRLGALCRVAKGLAGALGTCLLLDQEECRFRSYFLACHLASFSRTSAR